MAITFVAKTEVAQDTGGTTSVTHPTGLAAEDLMLVVNHTTTLIPGPGTPAGWTAFTTQLDEAGVSRCGGFFKLADATDVSNGSTDFTNNTASNSGYVCLAFRGVDQTTPINAQSSQKDEAGALSPSLTGLTPTTANSMLVQLWSGRVSGETPTGSGYAVATSNPTWTERVDVLIGAVFFHVATATRPETTGTGNASYTIGDATAANIANNFLHFVALTPAPTTAIKTFNGLATASVKTVNGLAIASVKSKNGLE